MRRAAVKEHRESTGRNLFQLGIAGPRSGDRGRHRPTIGLRFLMREKRGTNRGIGALADGIGAKVLDASTAGVPANGGNFVLPMAREHVG